MTPVIFEERKAGCGHFIGVVTLNSPRSLNALNHEMITLLSDKLSQWEQNPNIACIYLQGAGEKAFCAGGDIREVYHRLQTGDGESIELARKFISEEYALDYQIFSYTKPIICCGDGLVMGGGLGLLAASSHRIVTENSRLAMPEIKIGLYPDVGATYFLGKLPEKLGLYIGLTSCLMNASDALHIDIAGHAIEHSRIETLVDKLITLPFNTSSEHNHRVVSNLLTKLHDLSSAAQPESNLIKHRGVIESAVSSNDLNLIYKEITAHASSSDEWLKKNAQTLLYGSPTSAHLIFNQMTLEPQPTREEARFFEEKLSNFCFETGEFTEGVRALLIDKDLSPSWSSKVLSEISVNTQNELVRTVENFILHSR